MRENYNLANVFGKEFNLSTEQVLQTIEKIYKLEKIDTNFRFEDVEVALYNCDFYVRPGADKAAFMRKFRKIFAELKEREGNEPEFMTRWYFAMTTIELIKESFDETYFKMQTTHREKEASGGKDKLHSYLKKLNETQLKEFMATVVSCRVNHGLFMSNASSIAFWADIEESCRKCGCEVPREFDSAEGERFLEKNSFYFFDVLDKRTIAAKLCRAIDLHTEMAGNAAKKLYSCGYEAMLTYLELKLREKR